jgi:hypothetical protein
MKTFVLLLVLVTISVPVCAGNGDLIVNGQVGIGTAAPSYKLDLITSDTGPNTGASRYYIQVENSANYGNSGCFFMPYAANSSGQLGSLYGIWGYAINGSSGTGTLWDQTSGYFVARHASPGAMNANVGSAAYVLSDPYTGSVNLGQGFQSYMNVGTNSTITDARHFMAYNAGGAGSIVTQYGLYIDNLTTGTHNYSIYTGAADSLFGGNVLIGGTTGSGSGGSNALLIRNGTQPAVISGEAGLYATESNGVCTLHAFDDNGHVTTISAHAQDAPDSLYDAQDGIPMIVKEIQHFLGYVRYTNKTRMARLAGMTDADKQALPASSRTCLITESFTDHESRTGEHLTLWVWEDQQAKIKAGKDAERQQALDARANLAAAIAEKTQEVASATDERKAVYQAELQGMIQRQNSLTIPDVYQTKPIPARLQAALGN